jgi:hypothetical protein
MTPSEGRDERPPANVNRRPLILWQPNTTDYRTERRYRSGQVGVVHLSEGLREALGGKVRAGRPLTVDDLSIHAVAV